jgi:hypothetical protein
MDALLSAPTESYSAFCQFLDLVSSDVNVQDASAALASLHKLALSLGVVKGQAAWDDMPAASSDVDGLVDEEMELAPGSTREATQSPSHVRLRLDNFVDDEAVSDVSDAEDADWLDVPSAGPPPAATPPAASAAWGAGSAVRPCPSAPPDDLFGDEELGPLEIESAEPEQGSRRAEATARLRSELRALVEGGAALPEAEQRGNQGEGDTGGWGPGVRRQKIPASRPCATSGMAGGAAAPPVANVLAPTHLAPDPLFSAHTAFTALPSFTASSFCERAAYLRWLAAVRASLPEARAAAAVEPAARGSLANASGQPVMPARHVEGEGRRAVGTGHVEPFSIDPDFDYDAVQLTVRFSVERARVEGEFYDVR